MQIHRLLSLGLVAGVLAGCVRPPKVLQGEYPATTVADAQAASQEGTRVRWGGTIVATTLSADRSCLEVISHRLDRRARPRYTDETNGRFIACVEGFLDPEVFTTKREVTVVGTVVVSTRGKVGEYEYVYPRVAVENVHLWPDRSIERDRAVYGVGMGGGYWGPWGMGGGWYGPGFGFPNRRFYGGGGRPRPRR